MECFLSDDEPHEDSAAQIDVVLYRDLSGVPCRFFLFPMQKHWSYDVGSIGIGATALFSGADWWEGGLPVPKPPSGHGRPLLLPVTEERAQLVARWEHELRRAGWKIVTSLEDTIVELGSKDGLRRRAERLGLLAHLPRFYCSKSAASYPCIAKPTNGVAGRWVQLLQTEHEATQHERHYADTGAQYGQLIFQEWVPGHKEYATSMVLRDGHIFAACTVEYKYDRQDYTWPKCQEVERRFLGTATASSHLRILQAFLADYTGICNANYKLTHDGRLRILEFNPRIGGDLGTDAPRDQAREMLLAMESLASTRVNEGTSSARGGYSRGTSGTTTYESKGE